MLKSKESDAYRLSVAPMMDWTDRHCRYFHRRFTRATLLYTEMVTTGAVLHGPRERLLRYDPAEQPVALQLGGSAPDALAAAARIGAGLGFCEINLNVGCPSERVRSGAFGAALMLRPGLVAACAGAMIEAAEPVPVTVKCRIGVDDQDPAAALPGFIETVAAAGVRRFVVHARKAWLSGLSPRENREVPPLDPDLVLAMKARFPQLAIVMNGGVDGLAAAGRFLDAGLDGVMIGRSAYQRPALLGAADRVIFGRPGADVTGEDAVRAMLPYIERERGRGVGLHAIARHMLGAFAGRTGARGWRRTLSEGAHRPGAGPELVERALAEVAGAPADLTAAG